MRYKAKIVSILLLGTLCIGAVTGCKKKEEEVKKAPAIPEVATALAKKEVIEKKVEITGSLAPSEEAVISIEADGRLDALPIELGSYISKGTVIARIATEDYQFKVRQADTELTAAEAEYKRAGSLLEKGLASQQQLDEAKRRLDAAQVNKDSAVKKLADCELKSPIDGMVARRMVNKGEYVRTGTQIAHIIRISPLKFKGDVSEQFAPLIKKGAVVLAQISSGEALTGKIVNVGPLVAAENRSFPIEALLDNPKGAVKPGSFGTLIIKTGAADEKITVPEEALYIFSGIRKMFVQENGIVHERKVATSLKMNGRIAVDSGIAEGESVIISGVDRLSEGMKVTIRK